MLKLLRLYQQYSVEVENGLLQLENLKIQEQKYFVSLEM